MGAQERFSTQLPVAVPADWLAERLGAGNLAVVDVRWYLDGRSGRDAYLGGHLPGAVFLGIDSDLSAAPTASGGRHPLPDPADFASALGAAGIGDETAVVAYDDTGGGSAGRLVWMLRALGSPAALLDGGIGAWPGPLETGEVTPPRAQRTPVPWPADRIIDTAEVQTAVSDTGVLLDARAEGRYTGEAPASVDKRPGHIPGARSAPWQGNLNDDGRFASPERLRQRFTALGVADEAPATAYCGSGVSACHNLLALEHAGFTKSRLYVGSWSAWTSDPDRPAETGLDREG